MEDLFETLRDLNPGAGYAVLRRKAILAQWPMEAQMEAHAEASMGRPERLAALQDYLLAVKAAFPK